MGTLLYALFHATYVTVVFVLTLVEMFFGEYQFLASTSSLAHPAWFWIFMAINAASIVIPVSKIIALLVEENEEEDGIFVLK